MTFLGDSVGASTGIRYSFLFGRPVLVSFVFGRPVLVSFRRSVIGPRGVRYSVDRFSVHA
jgi:hypothetical protein